MGIARFLAMTTAVAAGLLTAVVCGVAPAAERAPAASLPAMDSWLQDLQKRLNSTDAAERDAAQKEMASIAGLWQQPDLLQKLSEATNDPELRGLFRQRADLLRGRVAEKDAMNLPPISLSLHNGGMQELAEGLNAALDVEVFKFNGNSGVGAGFTLDVQRQPFWEVFQQLQDLQPFSMQYNGNGLTLTSNNLGVRHFAVNGPAMVYPVNTTYRRVGNLQSAAPPDVGLTLVLGVMVDPRVVVSRFTNFTITKASDEAGHDLIRPGQASSSSGAGQFNTANLGFPLAAVEGMGKRLALSCDAKIAIQSGYIEVTQDDIQNNLNKDLQLGSRTVRVMTFRQTGNNLMMQMTSTRGAAGVPPEQLNTPIQYRVTDANGKGVWSGSSQNVVGGSSSVPAGTAGPFRLQLRMTNKTQDLNLHFELKDIPLP